jgi:hypothetical protein
MSVIGTSFGNLVYEFIPWRASDSGVGRRPGSGRRSPVTSNRDSEGMYGMRMRPVSVSALQRQAIRPRWSAFRVGPAQGGRSCAACWTGCPAPGVHGRPTSTTSTCSPGRDTNQPLPGRQPTPFSAETKLATGTTRRLMSWRARDPRPPLLGRRDVLLELLALSGLACACSSGHPVRQKSAKLAG